MSLNAPEGRQSLKCTYSLDSYKLHIHSIHVTTYIGSLTSLSELRSSVVGVSIFVKQRF